MNDLTPVSLSDIAAAAVKNMYSSLDERRDYLPFFTYRLFDKDISLEHGEFDSPHVVGRYLDGLWMAERAFGIRANRDIVKSLWKHMSKALKAGEHQGDCLAWNEQTGTQPAGAWGHNQREAVLGILGASHLLGSEEILSTARALVKGIARITDHQGCFPAGRLTEQGWTDGGVLGPLPAQSGRMVRSLLHLHRESKDELALQLAREMAQRNRDRCFDPEGTWLADAGIHVHSIVGTITSLIDLALLTRDSGLLGHARAAFERGAAGYRSSYGWVLEMRGTEHERGEANNTGDILEAAILLARNVDPSYWDDAERILRNHLVKSQLRDPTLFKDSEALPESDARIFKGVAARAVGGFCFSSPADFMSHDGDIAPINTDLVGGATQALCEAYEAATEESTSEISVNLLFDKSIGGTQVRSHVAGRGRVEVDVSNGKRLKVRIPQRAMRDTVRIKVGGKEARPEWSGCYVCADGKSKNYQVTVEFELKRLSGVERLNGKEYRVEWRGDTVTGVEGSRVRFNPLY
jgi:hypothetical protein